MSRKFDIGRLHRYNGRWTPELGYEPEIPAGGPRLELLKVYVNRVKSIRGDGALIVRPDGPNNPIVVIENAPSDACYVAGDYVCYEVYSIESNKAKAWLKGI